MPRKATGFLTFRRSWFIKVAMGSKKGEARRRGREVHAPRFVRAAIRKLRARKKDWATEKDREYHDALFGSQEFYPFSFAYPGYITIRRFADLVSPFVKNLRFVLDLGCGPAEITCELARRHPGVTFLGVDHSAAGIERARRHATSLGLSNISFQVAQIEEFLPDRPVDLVTMFDAFHHLANPKQFVRRMRDVVPRVLLIEPRGDWKGSWRKDLEFDWLLLELDKIGARLALSTGETQDQQPQPGGIPHRRPGEPVEHRYTLDDFRNIFEGFGLRVRGTVSGLEGYPPAAANPTPSRIRFWELAYEIYSEIDERLRDRGLDLLAKHWVIYAEKGLPEETITVPEELPGSVEGGTVQGAYDAQYLDYNGPSEAGSGQDFRAKVTVRNCSFRVWSSRRQDASDYLSYHWIDRRGGAVVWDGERTPLPRDIGPGEEADILFRVKTPGKAGKYVLAVELIHEGISWASDAGVPWLAIPFRIRKSWRHKTF
jgi:SAM-dependent methyltransferase